jgi:hypothetical protein
MDGRFAMLLDGSKKMNFFVSFLESYLDSIAFNSHQNLEVKHAIDFMWQKFS